MSYMVKNLLSVLVMVLVMVAAEHLSTHLSTELGADTLCPIWSVDASGHVARGGPGVVQ